MGIGSAAALAVAAVLVAALVAAHRKPPTSPSTAPIGPVVLSASGLRRLASTVGQPIYWAGPRRGSLYELTRTADNRSIVRYVPPGVVAGSNAGRYLSVATYPFIGAFRALQEVADGQGSALPDGGLAVVNPRYPSAVHLAFPLVEYQVEVYDPSPARVRAIAASGHVRAIR
jgi:hypothetical protein